MVECSAEPSVYRRQDGSPYLFQTNLVGATTASKPAPPRARWSSFYRRIYLFPALRRIRARKGYPLRLGGWAGRITSGRHRIHPAPRFPLARRFTKLAAEQFIEVFREPTALKAAVNRCGVIADHGHSARLDHGVVASGSGPHFKAVSPTWLRRTGKRCATCSTSKILPIYRVQSPLRLWDGCLGNVAGPLRNSASLQELTGACQESPATASRSSPFQKPPLRPRIFIGDCRS
jgi:hypothetical protein